MRRLLVALSVLSVLSAVALATGPAAGAAKGGWAIVSYDPLPALVAGDTVDVTFRLLQHGVTPVDPGDWPGLSLQVDVRGPDGMTSVPAVSTGGDGRYTASVIVPEGDDVGLTVVWPGGLLLESAAVNVPVEATAGPADGVDWWVVGLAALALAAAALVVVDVVRGRSERTPEPAAVPSPLGS